MTNLTKNSTNCCDNTGGDCTTGVQIFPQAGATEDTEPCCGPPAGPPSSPYERPGYQLCKFVTGFVESSTRPIPVVHTRLDITDHLGTLKTRLGFGRNDYKVAPGLYSIGHAGPDSPVLVTANYKLTFDTLRSKLTNRNLWLLVVDTRGINVWCAAGKGTFGTQEVVQKVKEVGLDQIVHHRELILPQLSATGVSAREVKKKCGFQVAWGPVRTDDIPAYLDHDNHSDPAMRQVTFTLAERLVLIPVELTLIPRSAWYAILIIFILSGIGPHIFSFQMAWNRGLMGLWALLGGILGGVVITPLLLPWLPGRAFAIKGTLAGLVVAFITLSFCWSNVNGLEVMALLLLTLAVSSFLAMNFTGSTPFTSPTGVEREMRKAIPLQITAVLLSLCGWIGAAFTC